MKVKFKRFDTTLPLPEYQSPGAAALDLAARITVTILPHATAKVPLNVAIQLPPHHWVLLAARSSLHKKGLIMANGIGVGDEDYCGDNDEYQAALYNLTDQPVVVERGERITQMIVLPLERVEIEEVDQLDNKDRGSFGTTGWK